MSPIKSILKITLGCILLAFGISVFFQPNAIAPGGFSGIAILINFLTDIPSGTIIMILNVPLAIFGYKILGKRFMISTIYAIICSSLLINIFSTKIVFRTEPLLAAIYGGILLGSGLGLCFSVGSSTGGTDIITRIIRTYKPHLSIGQIMISLDLIVVIASVIVFQKIDSALYSAIALYISSKMIDSVIEGPDLAKLIYIISDYNEEIGKEIGTKIVRGSTLLNGSGTYTKAAKNVLICAVRRNQIPAVKEIASTIDSNCFMIVTDVREVLGHGFKLGGKKNGL